MMRPKVLIFTDGACQGNPGRGGWAYLLQCKGREKLVSGGESDTTNNRMELRGVIEGLKALKQPCSVEIYTDSKYVQKGMLEWIHIWQKNNWKTAAKKPVKNQDLWEILLAVSASHELAWHWVKGHSGHAENERVDEAARIACNDKLS